MRPLDLLRRSPLACYLVVTYAVTWSAWLPLAAPRSLEGGGVTVGFAPRYLLGLLGPMVGALVTTILAGGRSGVRDLAARMVRRRVGARWWAVAFGLPLGIAIAWYAGLAVAGQSLPPPSVFGEFNGLPIMSVPAMWLALTLINGFGEETGWRGFLLPRLQAKRSPLKASLILAVLWGIWHVPAFWVTETYRLMPVATIPMFLLGLASGSVFLTWLYNGGGSSVLVVAVWHGTFNLFSGTVGARGMLGAIESAVVMVIAGIVVVNSVRSRRGGAEIGRGPLTPAPMTR
jgi:membrane protease YdiL (CAAX protease family)